MLRILFIDDDDAGREMAVYNLRKAGHEVDEAADAGAGLAAFRAEHHDLVVTDVRMPGMSGIELTRAIHAEAPETPVVVITAFGSVELAVEAMKAGAYDFVLKPFSRDQLQLVIERASERQRLVHENAMLRRQVRGIERPIVHGSKVMRELIALVDRVAGSAASVLVTGESGTGKELVARRIHARSPRGDGPFVAVNCAGIPSELIESELFGHEKGSFSGALRARRGRFRQATGGTIFLDEIGELPPAAQSKLLRVLQEGAVDVVGSDEPEPVDVRLVAATNKDLVAEVAAGRFRDDLYYRLNVVELRVPALREHREDIPALVTHFVRELSPGEAVEIPEQVVTVLAGRSWPGNVRELRNACERLVVLSPPGELALEALSQVDGRDERAAGADPAAWLRLPADGISLLDLEKAVIEQALATTRGNISEAARYLRIPRHILVYRIEKYGIARPAKS